MNILDTARMKRLRGAVLTMVYTGHREQRSRLDDVALWGLLQDLRFDVSQNDVLTVLQDLQERKYLTFETKKNRITGRVGIFLIQITPPGRDLVEGTEADVAVVL